MTKEEILKEHLTGHYIIADKTPASEVDDFRKSILKAMDKYAKQQVNHFVSAPVSVSDSQIEKYAINIAHNYSDDEAEQIDIKDNIKEGAVWMRYKLTHHSS